MVAARSQHDCIWRGAVVAARCAAMVSHTKWFGRTLRARPRRLQKPRLAANDRNRSAGALFRLGIVARKPVALDAQRIFGVMHEVKNCARQNRYRTLRNRGMDAEIDSRFRGKSALSARQKHSSQVCGLRGHFVALQRRFVYAASRHNGSRRADAR